MAGDGLGAGGWAARGLFTTPPPSAIEATWRWLVGHDLVVPDDRPEARELLANIKAGHDELTGLLARVSGD